MRINNFKPKPLQDEKIAVKPQPSPQVNVDPKAEEWKRANPWFGSDTEMTGFALAVHDKLVSEEGLNPQSDEYYQRIDGRLRQVFPEKFASEKPVDANQRPKANVVASATRSVAPKKITLTASEVNIAKRLNIPLERYAREVAVLRRNNNGNSNLRNIFNNLFSELYLSYGNSNFIDISGSVNVVKIFVLIGSISTPSFLMNVDAGVGGGTLSSVCINGNTTATGITITAGGLSTNAATVTSLNGDGGVLFTDGSGNLQQDVTNFVWDDVNYRLGIGATGAPSASLDIHDSVTNVQIQLNATYKTNYDQAFYS